MQDDHVKRVDCLKCAYFAITWDINLPKACKLHGFKSAYMPSITVYKSSGVPCMGFVKKELKKQERE